ncbi:hypothetical protein BV25DRAFT_623921 [Artomyces pyxidatus]|uniref:Uncharacterized protein n=1 Tax=Artomyces pyxidatus TaxID=48021 RepID=A0ACB8T2A3_9AGAM|nr:hypothetical protein BV25DRAFT_623921 [Artomyces pyxidatus]
MAIREAKLALDVVLPPQANKIQAVRDFVALGPSFVDGEPDTLHWYGYKTADKPDGTPGFFGIFDTFPGEEGRSAHVGGGLATALFANADALLSGPPQIAPVGVLGRKAASGEAPKVGLRVIFSAKAEAAEQLKALIGDGEALVHNEPKTLYWYVFEKDHTTFGVVVLFNSDEDRMAHISSHAARTLEGKMESLLAQPVDASFFDVIASKTSS